MRNFFSKPITVIIACTVCLSVMISSLYVMSIFGDFISDGYYYDWLKGTSGDPDTPGKDSDGNEVDYPDKPVISDKEEENWAADPKDPTVNWPEEEQKEQMVAEITEVFHDQAGIYMTPYEPKTTDPVTIRLRTDRYNVTKVTIYFTIDYGKTWKSAPMKFNAVEKNKLFDAWGIILPAMNKAYYYYFEVGNDNEDNDMFYGLYGMSEDNIKNINKCFYVKPGHTTPDWSKGNYWYSLNVNSFYNGDPVNDHAGQQIDLSSNMDVNGYHYKSMYSGDLKGVQEKLDYIQSYGIEGIYMQPIMGSDDIGGYGWKDPYSIATRNGNEQAFINLSKAIHDKDMYICLDPVIALFPDSSNLANSYGIYPLKGAMQSQSSKYYDVFHFFSWPNSFFASFSSLRPNYSNKITQQIIYSEPDSYLQRFTSAPYNVDAYRFDSSIMLWGDDTAKQDITAAFKKTIKSINNDVLFMGENYQSFDQGWETTWGSTYQTVIRSIAQNVTLLSKIKTSVIGTVNVMPRSAALSSYVYTEDVDQVRLRTEIDQQWRINTATLFYMTYLGSPALRFGNETDSEHTTNGKFVAFNWDESTWNYENNYLIRALGELRNNYDCLKDGVVKFGDIKDSQQLMTFARWDLKNTVITAINRTATTAERELDVKQFGIVDGTIITDYLTGAKYTVKDGKINAKLLAGGSILVTDGKTCSYRNRFAVSLSKDGEAVNPDVGVYELSGKGNLDGKKDTATIALTPVFGAFNFAAKVTSNGEAAIIVKASEKAEAKAYTVAVKDGKLTVLCRTKDGVDAKVITTAKAENGSIIGIVRGTDNSFYATVNGGKVENSEVSITMDKKVFAGMAVASGSARFTETDVLDKADTYYADFESETLPAIFNLKGNGKVENGSLKLSNGDSFTAVADINDYTVKSTFESSLTEEGSYAGIAAVDGSGDMVFAGRAVIDGASKIVLARILNGELVVYASASDTNANGELIVQLQRIGNYFTMAYRIGSGKWRQLDTRIHNGMSNPDVGAVVSGKNSTMSVGTIGFGNTADGGSSKNTPISLVDWADKSGSTYKTDTLVNPKWRILTDENNWDYTTGGIRQNKKTDVELMLETSITYTDFRAEVTIDKISGGGYAGILFGKKTNAADTLTDGYTIKLEDGKITLLSGTNKLAEKKVSVPDDGLRIIVERVGKLIAVFYGTESKLAFTVNDNSYNEGYFGVFTSDLSALFANYDIYSLSYTSWTPSASVYPAEKGIFSYASSRITITPSANSWAVTSMKGFAFTDFQAQATITTNESGYTGDGYVGFQIGASEGVRPEREGMVIALKGDTVVVIKNGEEVASAAYTGKSSNTLKVVAMKGTYTVTVNSKKVLEYTDSEYSGGAVAIAAYNQKGTFTRFTVADKS